MRLSMATTLLNLRVASSFRAVSSSPTFPASSRMSDCCFSEHVVRKKGQKAFRLQQYLTKEARRLAKDKERERQQMLEPHTPH